MLPIWISFSIGIVLTLIPLPEVWDEFKPEWVALLVFYWTLTQPNSFGIVSAWLVGLCVDVLTGSLLGQHALGYITLSYMAISISSQYPMLSVLQQLLTVFVALAVYLLLKIWIIGISGTGTNLSNQWSTIILSTLLWHWLCAWLDRFNNR